MKFCANLSFMFTEYPFLERYKKAKEAGFKAVESGFPFGFTQDQVATAKNEAKIQQVLMNVYTGDVLKGELGFAAIPGKEQQFKDSLQKTIAYAKLVDTNKIHIMSGKVEEVTEANNRTYQNNLKYAAKVLADENILGVIEPINKITVPNYYMNCYDKAVSVIKAVNSPNLKLMLDVFHLQHIRGNITNNIKDLMPYIGHVQIAQVPGRGEPNSSGELNYKYILEILKSHGYDDWIGLEYKPVEKSESGLKWIQELGFSL